MRDFFKGFLACFAAMMLLTINSIPICLAAEPGYPDWLMSFYYILIPLDAGIANYFIKKGLY